MISAGGDSLTDRCCVCFTTFHVAGPHYAHQKTRIL